MSLCRVYSGVKLIALGGIVLVAGLSLAQPPAQSSARPLLLEADSSSAADVSKATVVKMSLHPAAAPVPALKYHLLPEVRDLKPGNAALLYQRAQSLEWWAHFIRSGEGEKLGNLLDMPLRKMPRDKIVLVTGALREMDLAARREYCDWEMTPRLREEGFAFLLPDVQGFRTFSNMLALRARLEMLDGRLDQAVFGMQTGFALSRHVGEAPIIINALVGMALAHNMLSQLEDFVQLDKAPNLYWALADLPRPFIDLRRPLQGEKVGIASGLPDIRAALKDRDQPPMPPAAIKKYLDNLHYVNSTVSGTDFRLYFTLAAARVYPAAKKHLQEAGFSAEQLGAMPVTQVALMYAVAVFDDIYDDAYKWQNFPYWQARPGMARAWDKFRQMRQEQPETVFLATYMMPAVDKVMFSKARLDRRLAMLQIIEAIRLYAAAEGRLPERLDDVRAVPIPIDPVTGKAFAYTLKQGRAILYAPPPPGEAANDGNALRYELTLAAATSR